MEESLMIPYVAHEGAMARSERQNKRRQRNLSLFCRFRNIYKKYEKVIKKLLTSEKKYVIMVSQSKRNAQKKKDEVLKMKKSEIKVFEELLKDANFKGKDQLKWLLWRNTTEPKYKVGDCYRACSRGQSVWGYPVKDFKATIKKSYCYKTEMAWYYEMEAVCICNGKEHTTTIYTAEYNMGKKCDGNINVLGEAKSHHAEELSI